LPLISLPSPISRDLGNGLEIRRVEFASGHELVIRRRTEEGTTATTGYLWWLDGRTSDHAAFTWTQALVNALRTQLSANYYIAPRRSTRPMAFQPTLDLMSDGGNLTNVVGHLFTDFRHTTFVPFEQLVQN